MNQLLGEVTQVTLQLGQATMVSSVDMGSFPHFISMVDAVDAAFQ